MPDPVTPEDPKPNTQGATAKDLNPAETGEGPAGPPPESNKPPAEEKPKADEKPEDDKPKADEGDQETSDDQKTGEEDNPDDKGDDTPLDTDVWGTTGDKVGDSALTLLQNAGVTVDEAKSFMFDAVKAGDPSKIDEKALVEKVGENKANLILAGVRDFISRSAAKAQTILNEVHTAVGGKDNWDAVTTWANKAVPEGDMQDYIRMIDAGGAQARFAAKELSDRYNADSNNTSLNANAEVPADGAADTKGRAISKAEYVDELAKLYDSGRYTPAAEAEINAARARGRAKGI